MVGLSQIGIGLARNVVGGFRASLSVVVAEDFTTGVIGTISTSGAEGAVSLVGGAVTDQAGDNGGLFSITTGLEVTFNPQALGATIPTEGQSLVTRFDLQLSDTVTTIDVTIQVTMRNELVLLDRAAFSASAAPTIAILGTSLVQQANGATVSASSPVVSRLSRGWIHWADVLSYGRYGITNWYDETDYPNFNASRGFMGLNVGQSGFTAEQIFTIVPHLTGTNTSVFGTIDSDVVIVDAGTNDVAGGVASVIQATREAICNDLVAAGKTVVLCTILSRAFTVPSYADGDPARQTAIDINTLSATYAAATTGVHLWDWNADWTDPATGAPFTGYSYDGTHISALGAYVLGKSLVDFLDDLLAPISLDTDGIDDDYDASTNPQGNLISNAFFTGTSGTVGTGATGTVAAGFNVDRSSGSDTITAALVPDPYGGQMQRLTMASTGTNTFRIFTSPANTTITAAGANEWMQARVLISVENPAAIREIQLLVDDIATNGQRARTFLEADSTNWDFGERWQGVLTTPALKLTAGTTSVRWRIEVETDGTGSPQIEVRAATLQYLPDPIAALNFQAPHPFVAPSASGGLADLSLIQNTAMTAVDASADFPATGDTLTYSATGLPSGLSIDSTTGVISGTPTALVSGQAVVITATDTIGRTATSGFQITVAVGAATYEIFPLYHSLTDDGPVAGTAERASPLYMGLAQTADDGVDMLMSGSGFWTPANGSFDLAGDTNLTDPLGIGSTWPNMPALPDDDGITIVTMDMNNFFQGDTDDAGFTNHVSSIESAIDHITTTLGLSGVKFMLFAYHPEPNGTYAPSIGTEGSMSTSVADLDDFWDDAFKAAETIYYDGILAAVETSRPAADIELHYVDRHITNAVRGTALFSQPPSFWYRDDAPHGMAPWYVASAMVKWSIITGRTFPSITYSTNSDATLTIPTAFSDAASALATRSAALVAGTAVVPTTPNSNNWSVATSSTAESIDITVSSVPETLTAIRYTVDGGSPIDLSGATTGTYTVAMAAGSTSYDIGLIFANATGDSLTSTEVAVTSAAAADVTAPTLTSPTDAANGATASTGSVSTNEGNGTLYWVVTTSSTAPSVAQIQAGQDNSGASAAASGNQSVTATGTQNITPTGLTASTSYTTHYQHEDAAGNNSAVVSASGFTTTAAASEPERVEFPGGAGIYNISGFTGSQTQFTLATRLTPRTGWDRFEKPSVGPFELFIDEFGGTANRLSFNIDSNVASADIISGGGSPIGTEVSILLVADGAGIDGGSDTIRLYIDGTLVASSTSTFTAQTVATNHGFLGGQFDVGPTTGIRRIWAAYDAIDDYAAFFNADDTLRALTGTGDVSGVTPDFWQEGDAATWNSGTDQNGNTYTNGSTFT